MRIPTRRPLVVGLLIVAIACNGDVAPEAPVPAQVVIAPSTVSLQGVGATANILATVTDNRGRSAADPGMTWQSNSPAVAIVTGVGTGAVVTAVAPGAAIITVRTANGKAAAAAAVSVSAQVQTVALPDSVPALDLLSRRSQVIAAKATADNGVIATYRWSVAEPAVIALSADTGATVTITALSVGSTMLTVHSRSQFSVDERADTVRIRVVGIVYSLSVTPQGARLLPGQNLSLLATVTADPGTNTQTSWRSRNPVVATVSAVGTVTATGPGTTFVVASSVTDSDKADSASITVTESPITQAVTSWETVLAPPMPGAGARWFSQIVDMAYTSTGDLIVVADCGLFVRNGSSFNKLQPTAPYCPERVITSGSHTVVLGSFGSVFRLSGGASFTNESRGSLPGGFVVTDAWLAPTGQVIVAGNNRSSHGALYQLVNGYWEEIGPSLPVPILAVSGSNASNLLVSTANGELLRLSGTGWVTVASLPPGAAGTSVWSPGPGDYYIAAGASGAWRLNGSTLTRLSTTPVSGVSGTSASDVLFIRDCGLDRWTGSTMQVAYIRTGLGDYCYTPLRLAVSSAEVAHTAYSFLSANPRSAAGIGQVVRLSGNPDLRSVAATSLQHAIAVGEWGYVAHWNGTSWRSEAAPGNRTLYSVTSLSPTQNWAAGDGVFFYDGTTWQMVDTHVGLTSIWATDTRNIWAVGFSGTVLRYDGSSWRIIPVGSFTHLRAVWGTGPGNMYVGGDNGLLLRFDGQSFVRLDAGVNADIYALHGLNDELWVGTSAQTIRRFDGHSWTSMTGFSKVVAYSLWVHSPSDAYATAGCVHGFEGGTFWRLHGCPSAYGVTGLSGGGAIVVGGGGNMWLGRNANAGFGSGGTISARTFGTVSDAGVSPPAPPALTPRKMRSRR